MEVVCYCQNGGQINHLVHLFNILSFFIFHAKSGAKNNNWSGPNNIFDENCFTSKSKLLLKISTSFLSIEKLLNLAILRSSRPNASE